MIVTPQDSWYQYMSAIPRYLPSCTVRADRTLAFAAATEMTPAGATDRTSRTTALRRRPGSRPSAAGGKSSAQRKRSRSRR